MTAHAGTRDGWIDRTKRPVSRTGDDALEVRHSVQVALEEELRGNGIEPDHKDGRIDPPAPRTT